MKEGTSAVLLQSGLGNEEWPDSTEYFCYLRNIQDLLSDGKTPYERRFGIPFNGPVIPFGAMVECHFISVKDPSRLDQFGAKVLPGKFFGYVAIWRDIMVADIAELEEMDASELHARRLKCKGSVNAAKKWKLHIPSRRWKSQNLRWSTASENIHLNPGSSRMRRGTRRFSRRIRRTIFSNTTTRGLNTG